MAILAVNAGSSSLKFSLHPLQDGVVMSSVLTGSIEGLEPQGSPLMHWTTLAGSKTQELNKTSSDPFQLALQSLRDLLTSLPDFPALRAVAHRVVHGGADFFESVRVTDLILKQLEKLNSLAPLHQPHNLAGIRAFQQAFPSVPQVACFDTAFHASAPLLHQSFALPTELRQQGIRRYGFHGLSYQYIMSVLEQQSKHAHDRVLMAHLGNGASLCAAHEGKSCASTMGFSALDGLMMGTRAGNLDPGVVLYLLEQGWTHDQLQTLLYKQSGLLGVSAISADMRTLRAKKNQAAEFAIDLFTHRIVRESGAMVACMEGIDVLAFSGGIGEHDGILRQQVCQKLSWLGLELNQEKNQQATGNEIISVHAEGSAVEIWVIPTDEGRVAAREAAALINKQ
jgi:acetate kinase